MDGVDDELVMKVAAGGDAGAGAIDGVGLGGREMAEALVGAGGGLFDQDEGTDELWEVADGNADNGKVGDRAHSAGMNRPPTVRAVSCRADPASRRQGLSCRSRRAAERPAPG